MPKVNVPQHDGEITITTGDSTRTYKVTSGTTTVAADDLAVFLAVVDGANEAKPAATKEKK